MYDYTFTLWNMLTKWVSKWSPWLATHMASLTFSTAVIWGVVIFVVVTDIFLALNGRPGDTYSEIFRTWSYRWAVLPVITGSVVGHWFLTFGMERPRYGFPALVVIWVVVLCIDMFTDHWLARHTHPGMWTILFLALGSWLWALEPDELPEDDPAHHVISHHTQEKHHGKISEVREEHGGLEVIE